jgi:DNA-binding NtrC family response regulator
VSRGVVVVVDDERVIRRALASRLEEAGYEVVACEGVTEALAALAASPGGRPVDAMLVDIRLKDGDGLALLEEVRRARPSLPVIMATAYGDSERAIRAMRLGAFEYVTKPFDLDMLLETVARAVVAPKAAAASALDVETEGPLLGSSKRMLEVWKAIGRAAASTAPVLVTGETGVGKELVARAIHDHGDRKDAPFVAVNIAAVPETLVESELFGHEKGAFTGATARREGRFEAARGGTLFLDEIADLPQVLQTKLLRVLEDGGFERVGGTERIVSTARIVSATSKPVGHGGGSALREDLFYRLGVLPIEVPPLRDRKGDIPTLVHAFLRQMTPRRSITEAALAQLAQRAWPGNVRELRHVIQQAAVMSSSDVLDVADFASRASETGAIGAGAATAPDDLDLKKALDRLEKTMIEEALLRSRGNRTEAARLLGIRRALLYARLKHHGFADDES